MVLSCRSIGDTERPARTEKSIIAGVYQRKLEAAVRLPIWLQVLSHIGYWRCEKTPERHPRPSRRFRHRWRSTKATKFGVKDVGYLPFFAVVAHLCSTMKAKSLIIQTTLMRVQRNWTAMQADVLNI
ncbi:hypothetical protein DFH06DRAFT_1146016 [Mycena polygramma]|nr:hypothetical protein DFH06DRAFT_1146016 [Mycena polygramma]